MFDGTAFCPACGAARAVADIQPSSLHCPACTTELSAVAARGHAAARVPHVRRRLARCVGIRANLHQQRVSARRSLARPPAQPRHGNRAADQLPAVRALRQDDEPRQFCQALGTIIDVCRGHGTFLDSGELHAIVTFIHGGGLERVRQHELDSLKEAKRQLDAAKSSPRRTRQSTELGFERWDAPSLYRLMAAIFGR